jgi:hypothetical protein
MRALPKYDPINIRSLDPYNMVGYLQQELDTPMEQFAKAQQLALTNDRAEQLKESNAIQLEDLKRAEELDAQFRNKVKQRRDAGEGSDPDTLLRDAEEMALQAGDIDRAMKIRNSRENADQEKATTVYNSLRASRELADIDPMAAADLYNRTGGRISGQIKDGNKLKRPERTAADKPEKPPFKRVFDVETGAETIVTPQNWEGIRERIDQGELSTMRPKPDKEVDPFLAAIIGTREAPTPTPTPTPRSGVSAPGEIITRRIGGKEVKFKRSGNGYVPVE